MSTIYQHQQHPYIEERQHRRPVRVDDQRPKNSALQRFNSWLGLKITLIVGTMICAYVFAAIALISLPSNVGSTQSLILWISSSFLQLVLLPIIIVGQNIQAQASDKRSEATYKDAGAILHEALQIQHHLEAQDRAIQQILDSMLAVQGSGSAGAAGAASPPRPPTTPPSSGSDGPAV